MVVSEKATPCFAPVASGFDKWPLKLKRYTQDPTRMQAPRYTQIHMDTRALTHINQHVHTHTHSHNTHATSRGNVTC